MDEEGFSEGTFNTHFQNLSSAEREKNLALAKAVPFSETNKNLKEYCFESEKDQNGKATVNPMRQLLIGMRNCGLKNDALMDTFYEVIGEKYQTDSSYAIYVFHDRYDIPAKGKDHERLGESENVYEYLICVICPLENEYEPGEPECGFLFPAFLDGGAALNCVDIYQKNTKNPHTELKELLGCRPVDNRR